MRSPGWLVVALVACKAPPIAAPVSDPAQLGLAYAYTPADLAGQQLARAGRYLTCTWADLEPTRGQLDLACLRDALDGDLPFAFRFIVVDPDSPALPGWFADQGIPLLPYTVDGDSGVAPDFSNPVFLDEHARVLTALATALAAEPGLDRLTLVEVGSMGFWGEWHVTQNPALQSTITPEAGERVLGAYLAAFPDLPKAIAFDVFENFPTLTEPVLDATNLGLRFDCLGYLEDHAWFREKVPLSFLDRLDGPMGGEFCGSDAGAFKVMGFPLTAAERRDYLDTWGGEPNTPASPDEVIALVRDYRWTFVGGAGAALLRSDVLARDKAAARDVERLFLELRP